MTRAIIVGGGMGGLAAALALRQHGVEVEVYEQARALHEVGAGLTLSTGALRSLDSFGMLDAVKAVSRLSARMPFVHYRTARLLWGAYAGPEDEDDTSAPRHASRHVFRADLQMALAAGLQARDPGALRLGHTLTSHTQDAGGGVTVTFANGHRAHGDVLIGADGLHSVVRGALFGPSHPEYTGQVAWRFLLDGAAALPHMGTGRATVFVGPDATVNRYTLRGGALLNCVAIVRTPGWAEEGWSIPGDPGELAALFTDWHPDVRGLVAMAASARLAKWALCTRPALPTWRDGCVALLGDAAHPMLPFLGLGAAMAIEDAAVLGRAFGLEPDPVTALVRYEAARRPRATMAALASEAQGRALQGRNPDDFKGDDAPVGDRTLFDHDPMAVAI